MAIEIMGSTLRQLECLFADGTVAGLSDAELLDRFVTRRDELSFEALIIRHGPMVMSVCRAITRNPDEADDAFQATFLVLVRKAGSIRTRHALAGWLHRVAHRIAIQASDARARRRVHEREAGQMAVATSTATASDRLISELHEEIARLPEKNRLAVVLCDLQGIPQAQVAAQLCWSERTVRLRLRQARARLRDRLTRHELELDAPMMGAILLREARCVVPRGTAAVNHPRRARRRQSFVKHPSGLGRGWGTHTRNDESHVPREIADGVGHPVRVPCTGNRCGRRRSTGRRRPKVQPNRVSPTKTPREFNQKTATTRPFATKTNGTKPAPDGVLDANESQRLALGIHAQAAAMDKLPRFSYRVRYRHGIVDSMRAVDVSFDRLKEALTAPVLEKDWMGRYQTGFSWDEKRFLHELTPGESILNYQFQFWTATEAWERREANDKSSVNFVRSANPASFWTSLHLFDFSYLRVTPHQYWWGRTTSIDQSMSSVPPEKVSWRHLGVENFGGETCDVVDAIRRTQRLWIGRDSARLRGVLTYRVSIDAARSKTFYESEAVQRIAGRKFASQFDYSNWHSGEATGDQLQEVAIAWSELYPEPVSATIEPNELVVFDDYREVSPGVWLPFREDRTFPHASEKVKGKKLLIRSELRVQEVRTNLDLADQCAQLLPKEGDPVQDQRFLVPINLVYRASQRDEAIRKLAEAEYNKRLEGRKFLDRLIQPIAAMIGKPAPPLPTSGWIGGQPPGVAGKPYILHFWATWCGPCKNDLPRLEALARKGVIILGMHPSGTPAEDVKNAVLEQRLGYPTFLATAKNSAKIADYPSGIFPYYILIDAAGQVAGHGSLSDLLRSHGIHSLLPKPDPDSKQ